MKETFRFRFHLVSTGLKRPLKLLCMIVTSVSINENGQNMLQNIKLPTV